jgi:PleD family two-component response regulator
VVEFQAPAGVAVSLQRDFSMANQSTNTANARIKAKVLSVCNDGSVLRTRGMVLQNAGYKVCSAQDYGQAVNKCAAGRFDIAVLSASLPYDDRIALAAEVKKRWPATHVVMYCGIHEMPAHADAVIDPFDGPGALLFAIESTLDE